jgi:hypothetical protein
VPAGITEILLPATAPPREGETIFYRPALLGRAKVHYVAAKEGVDVWLDRTLLLPLDADEVSWDGADDLGTAPQPDREPPAGAAFGPLPAAAAQPKSYAEWGRRFAESLYRTSTLELRAAPSVGLTARPGETEGEFVVRVREAVRERRDGAVEELRKKFAARIDASEGRERRAEERVARERSQASQQAMQAAISVGATVFGALFGRKTFSASSVGRATTAARGMSRTMREREDVGSAEGALEGARSKRAELEADLQREIDAITAAADPDRVTIATSQVKPRKADIVVEGVALCWVPSWAGPAGASRPAR